MEAYGILNRQESSSTGYDPITYELLTTDPHPRGVMSVIRSNGIPYFYNVDTILKIISSGNKDPFQQKPFPPIVKQRAELYSQAKKKFPNYNLENLNPKDLYNRWKQTYSSDCKLDTETIRNTRLEAKCFLQAEDLTDIFQGYFGSGSMDNRTACNIHLEASPVGTWFLRPSSVEGDKYTKPYVLSCRKEYGNTHVVIVHRVGHGFLYHCYVDRGEKLTHKSVIDCDKIYPTIISLLEEVV